MVEAIAVPLALAFRPQLLLVSAGFDAHRDDPLATCLVTEDGFAAMRGLLRDAGAALGVPVAGVLEGGYELDALARSLRAVDGGAGGRRCALVRGARGSPARGRRPCEARGREWPSVGRRSPRTR